MSEQCEFFADSLLPKSDALLQAAEINQTGRLQVKILGQVLEYPIGWLRHNCQCTKCYNSACLSFLSSLKDAATPDMKLSTVVVEENGNRVSCVFSDDHTSEFNAQWLYHRRLTQEGKEERHKYIALHNMVAWSDPKNFQINKATYEQVTEEMEGFELFGDSLIRDGIFIITGAPDRQISEEFVEKVDIILSQTHYGKRFIVKNNPTPTNHAYTNAELELHTDQGYLMQYPHIQLLHCIIQSNEGGENVMSDGIKAATVLKERFPDYYKLLTTFPIASEDLIAHKDKTMYYMQNNEPVISLDQYGLPTKINHNNATHSSMFPGTADQYEAYLSAIGKFREILYEFSITIKSNPGDILAFDNQRVLHGRLSYKSTEQRELEGWYIDWDSVRSKLRVVKIKRATESN